MGGVHYIFLCQISDKKLDLLLHHILQSLCGLDDHWRLELEDVSTAIASSVGALCLSVTLATYLAPLTPHQQMEAINGQLVPLLDERGRVKLIMVLCEPILCLELLRNDEFLVFVLSICIS